MDQRLHVGGDLVDEHTPLTAAASLEDDARLDQQQQARTRSTSASASASVARLDLRAALRGELSTWPAAAQLAAAGFVICLLVQLGTMLISGFEAAAGLIGWFWIPGWLLGIFVHPPWRTTACMFLMAICMTVASAITVAVVHKPTEHGGASEASKWLLLLVLPSVSLAVLVMGLMVGDAARLIVLFEQAATGVPFVVGGQTSPLPWPGNTAPPTWWPHTTSKKWLYGACICSPCFLLAWIGYSTHTNVVTAFFMMAGLLSGPILWALLGWVQGTGILICFVLGLIALLPGFDSGQPTPIGLALTLVAIAAFLGFASRYLVLWKQAQSWEQGATIYAPLRQEAYRVHALPPLSSVQTHAWSPAAAVAPGTPVPVPGPGQTAPYGYVPPGSEVAGPLATGPGGNADGGAHALQSNGAAWGRP